MAFNLIFKIMNKIFLLGLITVFSMSCAQLSKKDMHIHLTFLKSTNFQPVDSVDVRIGDKIFNSGNSHNLTIDGTWLDTESVTLHISKAGFNLKMQEVSLQNYVDENGEEENIDIYVDPIYLTPN